MAGKYSEEIRTAAAAICGGEEKLNFFCKAAEAELGARLREELCAEDCGEDYITAAALLAAAMYCESAGNDGNVQSYTAGAVSVKIGSLAERAASAAKMRRQAESIMAPYMTDDGFAFLKVGGR